MLILFDIDGTLLLTEGAGIAAMEDAGRELFGPEFTREGVEFSGRLDSLIWQDLARINQIENHESHHSKFRARYGHYLSQRLSNGHRSVLLPGVQELVERLKAGSDVDAAVIGLLTGNYPETGRMKIARAGLDPEVFAVAAWGCDAMSRRDLTPIAIAQHHDRFGRQVSKDEVVVIGDTPHDVDCAKAHGCRSLGVATGAFTEEELLDAGADLAVADLAATEDIVRWIFER